MMQNLASFCEVVISLGLDSLEWVNRMIIGCHWGEEY